MAKSYGKVISLRIDQEIARQMPQFEEINWSAVARKAIENRIKQEKEMINAMHRGRMI